jgi:hypothetical protein
MAFLALVDSGHHPPKAWMRRTVLRVGVISAVDAQQMEEACGWEGV